MGRFRDDRLIIAFDFDGTLTTNMDIYGELKLRPGTAGLLRFLNEEGAKLILWTCRAGELLDQAVEFLKDQSLYDCFTAINEDIPDLEWHNSRKIYADYYVDDLAYGWEFETVDGWNPLLWMLEKDSYFSPELHHGGWLLARFHEFIFNFHRRRGLHI
ncbi:hypothetical protein FACS189447_03150 [Spirochaetia bacterium]|nr:hypothetical protein FACS189447_03150 [Spirochaetia bacterium]